MKRIKIVASEGNWLTNGELYGKIVYLCESNSPDDWYEISEEEYQEKTREACVYDE